MLTNFGNLHSALGDKVLCVAPASVCIRMYHACVIMKFFDFLRGELFSHEQLVNEISKLRAALANRQQDLSYVPLPLRQT